MAGWWGEDSAVGAALDEMMGSWANMFESTSLSLGNWWGSPSGQSFFGANPQQSWTAPSASALTNSFLAGSGFYGAQNNPWSGVNATGYSRNLAVGMGKDFSFDLDGLLDPTTWEEGSQGQTPGAPGSTAGVGSASGWEALNQFDTHFSSASQKVAQETGQQVPPNVVKALIGLESGRSDKQIGEKNCTIRPEAGCLAVWTGIFEQTAKSWGLDFNRIVNDPEYAIYAVTVGLTKIANYTDPNNPNKTVLESYGWEGVATYYFGGPNALKGGFTDELGRPSSQYAEEFMIYLDQLDAATGSGSPQAPGGAPDGYKPQPTGNGKIDNMVAAAGSYIGLPYIWGGPYGTGGPGSNTFNASGAPQGFDCSGFTAYLLRTYGGLSESDISTGSYEQFNGGQRVGGNRMDFGQLRPGDLVFFDTDGCRGGRAGNCASHVGMYIGNGQMVHSSSPETGGVIVSNLNDAYWENSYLGARRYT